jgi:hypothetical protein
MSNYNNNKPFKPIKIGIGEKILGTVKDFFKPRGRKVSPDINSVKPGKKFNKGGRVGLKFGGGADMGKKKSNIQKIKEAFGTKSKNKNLKPVNKKKNPGLAKLPIEVRNKMGYAKKGGRA